jgi:TonB family protein
MQVQAIPAVLCSLALWLDAGAFAQTLDVVTVRPPVPGPGIAPGDVTLDAADPLLAVRPRIKPDMRNIHIPPEPRRGQTAGPVKLVMCVDEHGRVFDLTIVESSGDVRIDRYTRRMIEEWDAEPGRTVEGAVTVCGYQLTWQTSVSYR